VPPGQRVELAIRARDGPLIRGDDVLSRAKCLAYVREGRFTGARVERSHVDEDVRRDRRDRWRLAEREIGAGEDRREVDATGVDHGTMPFGG
jgi:hypothetical protein